MCGRYVLRRIDAFRREVSFVEPEFEEFAEIKIVPRFNIAPSQTAPVIRLNATQEPAMSSIRWGFIPHWTKGTPKLAPINARSETAATSGMFKQAMERRRCLIPADGFYEPKGPKTLKHRPWYFFQFRGAEPFCFGGLWERWKPDPDAEPVDSFTILTTGPNEIVGLCHDRMPLIIHSGDYSRWLDRKVNAEGVVDLLVPYPKDEMESWRVGDDAKRPGSEGEKLIEPVAD